MAVDSLSQVFSALADPTRRDMVARLAVADATVNELAKPYHVTVQAISKHLRVLEDAGLVVARKEGREKHHFLNPVPIRQIHDRWIDKFTEHRVSALLDLKNELEESA